MAFLLPLVLAFLLVALGDGLGRLAGLGGGFPGGLLRRIGQRGSSEV